MKIRKTFILIFAALCISAVSHSEAKKINSKICPVEIISPKIILKGVKNHIKIKPTAKLPAGTEFKILDDKSNNIITSGVLNSRGETIIETDKFNSSGNYCLKLAGTYNTEKSFPIKIIPGWLSILPPLIAILLALMFRQVVPALFAGILIGGWIFYGNLFTGFLRAVDHYIISSLADTDHAKIIIFSLLLGGMVGIMSRSGGTLGLVKSLKNKATTSSRGQFFTWLLGVLVFFDDYANTLLVGNTMRPITDKLKVSREKLAYIVDSTAAPVACIALISTWIGYEISLINSSFKEIGSSLDAYTIFLQSIPYNFYPILALILVLIVSVSRRDFGPMLKAERRARKGKLLADTAVPLSDFENQALIPLKNKPKRWINAVIPVLTVLTVTFISMWIMGKNALIQNGDAIIDKSLFELGIQGIGKIFGASNSFDALLYGSMAGCIVALVCSTMQKIVNLSEGLMAWLEGTKSMVMAMIILVMAWALAKTCSDLNTSGFIVAHLSGHMNPAFLPALIFILSSLTSFATGTSWGAMGILIPLAVPTAYGMAQAAGVDPAASHSLLLSALSAVLAGAIFGDHCSPISDTTVMSSMSSGCDHIDHVKTQMPYAVLVGIVSISAGYIPVGFGVHPFICIMFSVFILALLFRVISKPVKVNLEQKN